jgi:hypothetical protein
MYERTGLTYLSLSAIHHWNILRASIGVLHMDHSGIDGSRVGQDLFEEARHASAFDGPYASFRKSQGDDCNVETRIWISVVGILEDDYRSAV